MRDFYTATGRAPLDQADGLRRLFAGRRRRLLPLAANPHVAASSLVLDRVAGALAAQGLQVLVVDAASSAPLPHELAAVDLSACVETIAERVAYLPARGLPRHHVDTRGSASGFIDALQQAAPQAEVLLLHADGIDLARMLKGRAARPVLLGADQPESIKHAYANAKLLVQRCGLMTFDLLLTAAANSPRAAGIVDSLGGCIETFLGALLRDAVLIDPATEPAAAPLAHAALARLLAAQLSLDSPDEALPGASMAMPGGPAADRAARPRADAETAGRQRQPSRPISGPISRPAFR